MSETVSKGDSSDQKISYFGVDLPLGQCRLMWNNFSVFSIRLREKYKNINNNKINKKNIYLNIFWKNLKIHFSPRETMIINLMSSLKFKHFLLTW